MLRLPEGQREKLCIPSSSQLMVCILFNVYLYSFIRICVYVDITYVQMNQFYMEELSIFPIQEIKVWCL